VQVLLSMIDDLQRGEPIKAMQPKAPKNSFNAGMNSGGFPGAAMPRGFAGPFGAGAGAQQPNQVYNPNAGFMTQQQQGFGMQQQFGMAGQPQVGMGYQPPMGMAYQQQGQQMMQQQLQSNGIAFL
jgi:hypothetical protein